MKALFKTSILVFLLVLTPRSCFAVWEIETVSKERAKALGMEVRTTTAGPNLVRVELEFKTEGELKNFTEDPWKNYGRVELRIGQGKNPAVIAPLREDRSKPGRIAVSFTADRAQLDKINLWVMVPGTLGGTIYDLRAKDFVESEKGP